MSKQMEQLFDDIRKSDTLIDDKDIDKINKNASFEPWKRIYWYYKDDLDYFINDVGIERANETIYDWKNELHSGVCVPLDGVANNGYELQWNDMLIVEDSYPTEKESPCAGWTSISTILCNKELVEIFGEQ